MSKHKHYTLNETRKIGLILFYILIGFSGLCSALAVSGFAYYAIATLPPVIISAVLTAGFIVKIQSLYTRDMLASIHKVDLYSFCDKCRDGSQTKSENGTS